MVCSTLAVMCFSLVTSQVDATPEFPWHLAGLEFTFDEDHEFSELSIDIFLQARDGRPLNQLFVAPLQATINGNTFYYGLKNQDNLSGNMKARQLERVIGPGYKFTRFGCESDEIVRCSPIGYTLTSDHEGPISGVCSAGTFKTGYYTFSLVAGEKAKLKDGTSGIWIDATVTDHSHKTKYQVGSIFFPGAKAIVSRQMYSFVELVCSWDARHQCWFSSQDRPYLDLVQECTIYVGNITRDGKKILPQRIAMRLPGTKGNKCKISMVDDKACCQRHLIPEQLLNCNTVKIVVSNTAQAHDKLRCETIFSNDAR